MYLRNQWYVAAWSHEVDRSLLERWLLDEPLVMYRTGDGEPVALANRCAHRRFPLSKSTLIGDTIECGYHGFTYDSSGACVRIPSQERIPPRARVHRYPTFERWGWVWVWMGDPALVDESLLPDHHWLGDPNWIAVGGTLHVQARYQLYNENLLDLSHLTYLHPGSIGTKAVAEAKTETEVEGRLVRVSRVMESCEPAPLHAKTMDLAGLVDRWQIEEFTPPGFHVIHVGSVPTGGDRESASKYKVLNAVSPETRTTTHYFWAVSRNYALDQDWVTSYLQEAVTSVFHEDIVGVEAQERMVSTDAEDAFDDEVSVKADAGVNHARKIMARLLAEEIGGDGSEEPPSRPRVRSAASTGPQAASKG